MKYADAVIAVMKSKPDHKFRMYELLHDMDFPHVSYTALRYGVHRALNRLIALGHVHREVEPFGKRNFVFQWRHNEKHNVTS